jgi:hypothetical protein
MKMRPNRLDGVGELDQLARRGLGIDVEAGSMNFIVR